MRGPLRRQHLAACLGLALALAPQIGSGQQPADPAAEAKQPRLGGFYVLLFNRFGDLINPIAIQEAIRDLGSNPDLERVVIVSYGWANDAQSSTSTYVQLVRDLREHSPRVARPGTVAVIAVGWDSSQTGFRKLLNGLIPLPTVADAIAFVPDQLLFPLSFWSKGATADRIGFGGLRSALNDIFTGAFPEPDARPDVYLIGHSFGTRIVSGLMQDRLGVFPVRSDPFVAADRVRGAVLVQPALPELSLHHSAHYPVLVTQSEHDHANGFLFPLANLLVNSFSFTITEALLRHEILGRAQAGLGVAVGTAVETVRDVTPLPRSKPEQDEKPEAAREPGLTSRFLYLVRRAATEVVSIPASIAFSLVATPVGYANTQLRGLATRPVDHVMDTLAQLPLIEVPVYWLGRGLGREVPWGRRSRGLLHFGSLNESIGRSVTPRLGLIPMLPVYSPEELLARYQGAQGCGLPTCAGIVVVDATPVVRDGVFGQNLKRPLTDFTLGWLDPIGAHGDYRNREVVRLMALPLFDPATE